MPRFAVGFTATALDDREGLPRSSEQSLQYAIDRLRQDPSANSPYRQEFDLTLYDPEVAGLGDGHFIRWIFGNVIIEYIYWNEPPIAVIVALTPTPPMM